uniref:Uncharacterized protein n=1 Tax=Mycolicibacterium neoaurum VKM Ac-1815D TaxID=700508 RepID=V5XJH4_MYCNE
MALYQRIFAPLAERLGGEPKHRARHRDKHAFAGKVTDQRVHL